MDYSLTRTGSLSGLQPGLLGTHQQRDRGAGHELTGCFFICTSREGISAALSLQPVLEIHVVCPTAACGALFLQATDRLPSRALSLKVPPLTRVLQRICLGTPGRNRSATHSLIRPVHLPSAVRPRLMTSEYLPT